MERQTQILSALDHPVLFSLIHENTLDTHSKFPKSSVKSTQTLTQIGMNGQADSSLAGNKNTSSGYPNLSIQ
jgi:hypothetical protein